MERSSTRTSGGGRASFPVSVSLVCIGFAERETAAESKHRAKANSPKVHKVLSSLMLPWSSYSRDRKPFPSSYVLRNRGLSIDYRAHAHLHCSRAVTEGPHSDDVLEVLVALQVLLHVSSDPVVLLAEDARGRGQRIYRGIDSELCDLLAPGLSSKEDFLHGFRLQEPWALLRPLPPSLRPKAAIRPSTARAILARACFINSWRLTSRMSRLAGRSDSRSGTGSGEASSMTSSPDTLTVALSKRVSHG